MKENFLCRIFPNSDLAKQFVIKPFFQSSQKARCRVLDSNFTKKYLSACLLAVSYFELDASIIKCEL